MILIMIAFLVKNTFKQPRGVRVRAGVRALPSERRGRARRRTNLIRELFPPQSDLGVLGRDSLQGTRVRGWACSPRPEEIARGLSQRLAPGLGTGDRPGQLQPLTVEGRRDPLR